MNQQIKITDLHCDTVLEIQAGADIRKENPEIHIDISRLKRGNVTLQVFACFIPSVLPHDRAFNEAVALLNLIKHTCSQNASDLHYITDVADFAPEENKRIFIVPAVENGHAIEHDLKKLEKLYENGARYMTLTHSKHLEWAVSSGEDHQGTDGLSAFGKEVIRLMNDLGMIIDVSHVHESTFWDVIRHSRRPVIASHSNTQVLCDTPRNLSDDQIKAIADNGGMIGINFFPGFLDQGYADYLKENCGDLFTLLNEIEQKYLDDPTAKIAAMHELSTDLSARLNHVNISFAKIIDHIEHIVNLAGEDCVGFGSDFDGVPSLPKGVHGCDIFPEIVGEMRRRGFSEDALRKICRDNFIRVWAAQR